MTPDLLAFLAAVHDADEQAARAAEWRPLQGMEHLYLVSDMGGTWSQDRWTRNGSGEYLRRGRPLGQRVTTNKHLVVCLSPDDGRRPFHAYVHRLVLLTFRGPCPEGMEGCHNDGDPLNNQLSNLRWDTRGANLHDMALHGSHHLANRQRCPQGHLLCRPNLVGSVARLGHRGCLACSRAQSYALRHPELDRALLADSYYRAIIGSADPSWHSEAPALELDPDTGRRRRPGEWTDVELALAAALRHPGGPGHRPATTAVHVVRGGVREAGSGGGGVNRRSYYTDDEWAAERAAVAEVRLRDRRGEQMSAGEVIRFLSAFSRPAQQRIISGVKAPWHLRRQQRRDWLRKLTLRH